MKPSAQVTTVASLLLVACLGASAFMLRSVDSMRTGATLDEVLYITSPKLLKRLSLGYDGLLADIYWTRAVQYFGNKHYQGAQKYTLLAPLLEITTTLDPHLVIAYEFGANFLATKPPNGAGMPQRAIQLAEFGIRNNPNEWHLYYDLGFIYYMELKDYPKASEAFRQGSGIPGAHPWLKLLSALMAEHAGDISTARLMWTATYQTTPNSNVRANAAAHLRALQVDEDVPALEKLVAEYREKNGHLPESLTDLETAGMLRGIPRDPLGNPYQLMPNGSVQLLVPDDFPFVQKGTPPGYRPPIKPKFLPAD
jgi:tetratricopeptide (TPR) repeat protein